MTWPEPGPAAAMRTAPDLAAHQYPPVVVTGATGWVGQAMVAHAAAQLGPQGVAEGRLRAFAGSARGLRLADGTLVPVAPLADLSPADCAGALVLHCAWLTRDHVTTMGAAAWGETNAAIDAKVLAAIAAGRPAGVFVASSGAAAEAAAGRNQHPYALGKLAQEALFADWATAQAVPLFRGRIWTLAGPGLARPGGYALAGFIDAALRHQRIDITARAPVLRSFLDVADCAALAIGALAAGLTPGEPADLCGGEVVEMSDLAELVAAQVAEHLHGPGATPLPVHRAALDGGPGSAYLGAFLDTRGLALRLSLRLRPLAAQVAGMVAAMAKQSGANPPGANAAAAGCTEMGLALVGAMVSQG